RDPVARSADVAAAVACGVGRSGADARRSGVKRTSLRGAKRRSNLEIRRGTPRLLRSARNDIAIPLPLTLPLSRIPPSPRRRGEGGGVGGGGPPEVRLHDVYAKGIAEGRRHPPGPPRRGRQGHG